MFGKRKNDLNETTATVVCDPVYGLISEKAFGEIESLNHKLRDMELENMKLREELDRIKPVLECEKLTPAVSRKCRDCKYVVKSSWNGDILGCCKDSVCESFSEVVQ